MELADPRTKVLALGLVERLQRAGRAFAAVVGNLVAPPVELGLRPLDGEEDDDARDGDAAGPSR